jgi:peptidyl-tRNA hydrolase, PTH1 family
VKLIVGLGNPGPEYRDTRHNVGFRVVDEIARRHQLAWAMAPSQVPDAFVAKRYPAPGGAASANAAALLLAKPLTFMNLSGRAVRGLADYYRIAPSDLLVVFDEVDLPFGKIRVRAAGSGGTHNGVKSIVGSLGTTEFPRIRVGIGRGDKRRDLADHVLSKFEPAEWDQLESVIARAADAAEMFAADGILKVMNTYNPDPAGSGTTD